MKNILFVISALYLLSFATVSSATGHTEIRIFGEVASSCTLTSSVPQAGREVTLTDDHDITTEILSTITVICNDANGYKVTFSSANLGELVNNQLNSETIEYQVRYEDNPPVKLDVPIDYDTNGPSTAIGDVTTLFFGFTGAINPVAGIWEDTVSVVVEGI